MPSEDLFAESPESVGIDPVKLATVFERARKEVEEGILPSSQIAVARNGRIAGMQTVGQVTHAGRAAPATDSTLYCVFSCTKAITSAAAWMLIDEGKLDLQERVADVVPEFGTNGKEVVTVEQLFTHTAGSGKVSWHLESDGLLNHARFFSPFEDLDLVSNLDVIVALHADTTFGATANLVDVILETPQ